MMLSYRWMPEKIVYLIFGHKSDKLLVKFEQIFDIRISFHNKVIYENKLYKLSKSVTKPNNKRDVLIS